MHLGPNEKWRTGWRQENRKPWFFCLCEPENAFWLIHVFNRAMITSFICFSPGRRWGTSPYISPEVQFLDSRHPMSRPPSELGHNERNENYMKKEKKYSKRRQSTSGTVENRACKLEKSLSFRLAEKSNECRVWAVGVLIFVEVYQRIEKAAGEYTLIRSGTARQHKIT